MLISLVVQEVLSELKSLSSAKGEELFFFTASKKHCSCYVQTMFGV